VPVLIAVALLSLIGKDTTGIRFGDAQTTCLQRFSSSKRAAQKMQRHRGRAIANIGPVAGQP
jgi:hypothetical protein